MLVREVQERDFDDWLGMRSLLWDYHTLQELKIEMLDIRKRLGVDQVVFLAEREGLIIGL